MVSVTLALWSLSFLICKKGLQKQFHLVVVEIKFEKAGEHSKQRRKQSFRGSKKPPTTICPPPPPLTHLG